MSISVEEFMNKQQEQGRSSKLEPFREDILALKQKGFSQKQIQQFLAQNNIQAGLTTINWFIRTRCKNKPETVRPKLNELSEKPKADDGNNAIKSEKTKPEAGNNPPKSDKFNWQTKVEDSDIF